MLVCLFCLCGIGSIQFNLILIGQQGIFAFFQLQEKNVQFPSVFVILETKSDKIHSPFTA